MTARPILFNGEMVRAILARRKTQTRRLIRWLPCKSGLNLAFSGLEAGYYSTDLASGFVLRSRDGSGCWNDRTLPAHSPHGVPGDRLWVRESWAHDADSMEEAKAQHEDVMCGDSSLYYRATEVSPDTIKWRPGIFMPRWASRITLEVADVRAQRLQEIRCHDIRAEGVDCPEHDFASGLCTSECRSLRGAFRDLWDSINGKRAPWASNPWVFATTFTLIEDDR